MASESPIRPTTTNKSHRLDSWKQIAAHFGKSERTVRRWSESEGMPVHRHVHRQRGSVWADEKELDEWLRQKEASPEPLSEAAGSKRIWLWGGVAAACIAILTVVVLMRFDVPDLEPVPEAIPLTALNGIEYGPTISPDGQRAAFFWGQGEGENGIYIKEIASERMVPLVTNKERRIFNYSPAWAPDGKTIAFLRRMPERETWLYLISPNGGPERRLAHLSSGTYFYANNRHLAWSADSQWIYAPMALSGDRRGIHRISALSGEALRMTNAGDALDIAPTVSPDGRTMAFMRYGASPTVGTEELFRLNLAGDGTAAQSPQSLYKGMFISSGLAWTPSGEDLILCKANSVYFGPFDRQLWRLQARQGGKISLLRTTDCNTVTVSQRDPAGRAMLVYGSAAKSQSTLWQAGLTSLEHPAPFAPSSRFDSSPRFSPDGSLVAFFSNRTGTPEVWVSRPDGSETRRVTENADIRGAPRWSPDGSRFVYLSGGHIQTIPIAGGKPVPIPADGLASEPSLSRDGDWLYYKIHRRIWRKRFNGGKPLPVIEASSDLYSLSESPDGKSLYYTREAKPFSLCKVPVEGGPETVISEGLSGSSFALSREFIYFVSYPDRALYQMPFERRPANRIGVLAGLESVNPTLPGLGISVAPDDSRIVYAIPSPEAVDLHLIRNFR